MGYGYSILGGGNRPVVKIKIRREFICSGLRVQGVPEFLFLIHTAANYTMVFIFCQEKTGKKIFHHLVLILYIPVFFSLFAVDICSKWIYINDVKSKLVQAWVEIHKDELMADWELASKGETVFKIDPLK